MSFSQLGSPSQGAQDAGETISQFPQLMAGGSPTSKVRVLATDENGQLIVVAGTSSGQAVWGPDAIGGAPTKPPVFVAGVDESGNLRSLTLATFANVNGTLSPTVTEQRVAADCMVQDAGGALTNRARAANSMVGGVAGGAIFGVGAAAYDSGAGLFRPMLGDSSGRQIVVGAAASGAAVAGSPVLIAGSDGASTINLPLPNNQVDAVVNATNRLHTWSAGYEFNSVSWDRHRNNTDVTLLASALRNTTQGPTNVTTYNARAIYIVLDMTNVAAGPSVTLKVEMIDPASGKAVVLLTGAAVTTVSTNIYKIGVGLTAAANLVANEYLPRTIAITVTANNANNGQYSVGYSLIAA